MEIINNLLWSTDLYFLISIFGSQLRGSNGSAWCQLSHLSLWSNLPGTPCIFIHIICIILYSYSLVGASTNSEHLHNKCLFCFRVCVWHFYCWRYSERLYLLSRFLFSSVWYFTSPPGQSLNRSLILWLVNKFLYDESTSVSVPS